MSLTKLKYDPIMIANAEEYMQAILWDKNIFNLMKENNEIDKRMLVYFWMSKNEELKSKRSSFLQPVTNDADQKYFNKRDDMQRLANTIGDTYDDQYTVCFEKWSYIVIWISKPTKDKREKPARGYQIWVSKNEAPLFYEYCQRLPRP